MKNSIIKLIQCIKLKLGGLVILLLLMGFTNVAYSQFVVTSTVPTNGTTQVTTNANIIVNFNANTHGGTSYWFFRVISDQRGLLFAVLSGAGTSTITLDPSLDFIPGEKITVYVTNQVHNTALVGVVDYVFNFSIALVRSNYLQTASLHVTPAGMNDGHYTQAVDLDSDGDMDMLVSDQNIGDIKWMENDGSENFTAQSIHVGIGIGLKSVHAADIDSDGDVDLLFTDNGLGTEPLKWYNNDGNENFTLTTVNATITGETTADLADMNGDGKMDIIVYNMITGQLEWLENDGAQNFSINVIVSSSYCFDVQACDVDRDGDMDILTSSSTNLSWFENDGSESFTSHIINATSQDGIDCADMDKDGDVDVLSASSSTGEVIWYKNDGSQNFSNQVISTGITDVQTVEAVDMDGDDLMDFVAGGSHIFWCRADRMQNFYAYEIGDQSDAMNYTQFDAADMDGDGDLDLAVYYQGIGGAVNNFGWFEMSPMLSTLPTTHQENVSVSSNIVFSFAQNINAAFVNSTYFTVRGQLTGIVAGVFSGGGTSTITFNPTTDFLPGELITVTINENVQRTTGNVLYGHHSFNFRAAAMPYGFVPSVYTKHLVSNSLVQTWATVPIDLDNDGDMDVVGINYTDGELLWYKNDGTQSYNQISISAVATPFDVSAVDLDDDGDVDILVASKDNTLYWFKNDGSENFTKINFPAVTDANSGFKTMYPADMDGDGDLDVVGFVFSTTGRILWFENDGSENFTFRSIELTAGAYTVHPIDMDGDGDLDIVSSHAASSELIWYENDGQMFTLIHTISTGAVGDHDGIYPIDADGDGDIDVFSCDLLKLVFHENTGNQVFTDHVMETGFYADCEMYAMDMDADLDVDLLFASGSNNIISWYNNDGSQNFTKKNIYTVTAEATDVFPADMDGDGDMDVLSNSMNDGEVFWLEFGCNCISWTGTVSTDWSNAGNWSSTVPTSTDSVLISSLPTNQPIVDLAPATPAECKYLYVQSDATLTIGTGKALTISGNTANDGTFTIASDATGTGSFIHSSSDVDATFQRYMNNADWTNWEDGWHFLSSPVASQTISSGFTTDSYDFYCWYELTNQWVNYKNITLPPTWATGNVLSNSLSNPTTNFVVGKGYMAAYDDAGTKSFTGTLNRADVEITGLDVTDGGTNRSWHLLGNPFSSGLTWDANWTTTTIGGTIQIWNEEGQSYTSILAATTGIIPATNGFMIQATADASAVTIPSSKRVHGGTFYKNASFPLIKLKAINNDTPAFQESQLLFHPESTTGYESEYDGDFLAGYAPLFYSKIDEMPMAVNSMPDVTETTSVPFTFIKNEGVNFSIEMYELESMNLDVWLLDKKLNKDHNLSLYPTYYFTAFENDNHERFVIHFSPVGINEQDMDQYLIQIWSSNNIININNPENIAGEITVYNMFGQLVKQTSLNRNVNQKIDLIVRAGYYIVNIVTSKQIINKKVYLR